MNTEKSLLRKIILISLLASSAHASEQSMKQTALLKAEDITVYNNAPENLKKQAVEQFAKQLADGKIDLANVERLCPDILEQLKEQVIFDNLLLLTGLFSLSFKELKGRRSRLQDAIFIPNANALLTSTGYGDPLRLWNLAEPEIKFTLLQNKLGGSIAISPCGKYVLSADGKEARLWNICDTPISHKILPTNARIVSVAFHPSSKYVLTALQTGSALLWDIQNEPCCVKTIDTGVNPISFCAFSPNGRYTSLVVGRYVYILDLQDGKIADTLGLVDGPYQRPGDIRQHTWSDDSMHIITHAGFSSATVWHLHGGTPALARAHAMGGHNGAITTAILSKDGHYVLTGSVDKTSTIWNIQGTMNVPAGLQNGPRVHAKLIHKSPLRSAAFHPEGRYVLTGTEEGAYLWDISQPKSQYLPLPRSSEPNAVINVSFSSNGKRAITGEIYIPQLWDFYREPQKISLTLLLVIIAASKDKKKASELKTACNTIEAFLWRDKSKAEHDFLKEALCNKDPLVKRLFELSREQIKALLDYDFGKCMPGKLEGLMIEAQRDSEIGFP